MAEMKPLQSSQLLKIQPQQFYLLVYKLLMTFALMPVWHIKYRSY